MLFALPFVLCSSRSCIPPPLRNPGSVSLTRGIRIAVAPSFSPDHSDPSIPRYTFTYRIRISNESDLRFTLLSRHWIITDADGQRHEVRGEGVVGEQPTLAPGESFTYSSFCPLPTSWGTMEGSYTLRADSGEEFDVQIGRFYLTLPADEPTGS